MPSCSAWPAPAWPRLAAPGLDPHKPSASTSEIRGPSTRGSRKTASWPSRKEATDICGWDEAGLVRFDGATFTGYNTANSSGIRDNFINALLVDRGNPVWGGTCTPGVDFLLTSGYTGEEVRKSGAPVTVDLPFLPKPGPTKSC